MPSRLKSKRRKAGRTITKASLCIISFILIIIGGWEARRFFPYPAFFARLGIENWQVWEFHDYFGVPHDTVTVIWNERRLTDLERQPVLVDGIIWFPHDFVRDYVDPFLFWDEGAQAMFVSTDYEVTRVDSENIRFFPGDEVPWISLLFFYNSYHRAVWYNNNVIFTTPDGAGRGASVMVRNTPVRYRPDRTAFITQRAVRGSYLRTFNIEGDYIRVRTAGGLLGYVLLSDIEFTEPEPVIPLPPEPPQSPNISLTWEMITAPVGNATAMQNPLPEGLTVISPTWFNFDPYAPDGTLISFASREYVEWAHAQNVEVWAKVFDTNHDISGAILSNYRAREHVIAQLLRFAEEYNLDGININFEHIRSAYGRYYVQFLRELAPEMRRISAVLSVATFVPAPWFAHYHHGLVGSTVDFVAIMTYDEHYGGSPEPGPVASLPFVRRSVSSALELIPRERILLGLPFYNRLWRVAPDGSHTSRLYGMARPWTLIEEQGVTPVWDPYIGSYYAHFNTNEATYRIWVECERSIAEKLRVFAEYELAGVAGWRRGLETDGVWDEIRRVAH